jgi:hypothetical protein
MTLGADTTSTTFAEPIETPPPTVPAPTASANGAGAPSTDSDESGDTTPSNRPAGFRGATGAAVQHLVRCGARPQAPGAASMTDSVPPAAGVTVDPPRGGRPSAGGARGSSAAPAGVGGSLPATGTVAAPIAVTAALLVALGSGLLVMISRQCSPRSRGTRGAHCDAT